MKCLRDEALWVVVALPPRATTIAVMMALLPPGSGRARRDKRERRRKGREGGRGGRGEEVTWREGGREGREGKQIVELLTQDYLQHKEPLTAIPS